MRGKEGNFNLSKMCRFAKIALLAKFGWRAAEAKRQWKCRRSLLALISYVPAQAGQLRLCEHCIMFLALGLAHSLRKSKSKLKNIASSKRKTTSCDTKTDLSDIKDELSM